MRFITAKLFSRIVPVDLRRREGSLDAVDES